MIKITSDLRKRFGHARDQGPRQTCLIFAISDTHSSLLAKWEELSVEYLYYHSLLRSKDSPPSGAKPRHVLEALRLDGQPLEAGWPYLPQSPTDLKKWTPPKGHQLYRRDGIHTAPDIDSVFKMLDQDESVIISMTISNAFFRPTLEGIIDSDEPADPTRRHAVIAVAHGRDKDGDKFLLIRNSWGQTWGLNGHAFLSVRYLEPRVLHFLRLKGTV